MLGYWIWVRPQCMPAWLAFVFMLGHWIWVRPKCMLIRLALTPQQVFITCQIKEDVDIKLQSLHGMRAERGSKGEGGGGWGKGGGKGGRAF